MKLAPALAACLLLSTLPFGASRLAAAPSAASPAAPAVAAPAPAPVWLAFPQYGTCRTVCVIAGGGITVVPWSATESQCCSGAVNPCPAGSTPSTSSFTPNGGFARICPIN